MSFIKKCAECGEDIFPDQSPGVWLHCDTLDYEGLDQDANHVAIPEENYGIC